MDPALPGPPAMERMVTVASCTSRVEAELKRGALDTDGFSAVVLTDDAGGVHPQLAILAGGGVRVAVPDHEADRARDLLVDLDAGVHALPATGEHERIDPPRRSTPVILTTVVLLGILLAYRAVTMVWPGMG